LKQFQGIEMKVIKMNEGWGSLICGFDCFLGDLFLEIFLENKANFCARSSIDKPL
jgi:hypothetical protein